MNKQFKKLNLSKRTISNLNASQMNMRIGGGPTNGNGNTCTNCPTAYTCVMLCTYYCGDGGGGGGTKGKNGTCVSCGHTLY